MTKPIEVSASILSADFAKLGEEIKRSEKLGVDRFHIDCMDGHFVPNLTIGPIIIQAIRSYTTLPIEAHLMVEHPGDYIESYAKAGADVIQIQVECYGKRRENKWNAWPKEVDTIDAKALCRDLRRIRNFGKKAYIVVNPGTKLFEKVLPDCDGVLVMSVNPGFAGQKFMTSVLPKVERLKEIVDSPNAKFKGEIAIDGGVNAETAPLAVKAGAHVLITASYLYGAPNPADVVKSLKLL